MKTKSWRGAMPVHPAADLFPMMSEEELIELGNDIKEHGLKAPIVFIGGTDSPGDVQLLDGRNRLDAMQMLGLPILSASGLAFDPDLDLRVLDPDTNAIAYVISAIIHRRHLTAEQKRDLIAKLLKADPAKSDRQIAATVKVDHKTVGSVRAAAEARGEMPHVEKKTDTKGGKQPARKPRSKADTITAPWSEAERRSAPGAADEDNGDVEPLSLPAVPKGKRLSKMQRWAAACAKAIEAIEELEELRSEWADIFDSLNEGLQQTPYGEKLQAMQDFDLESALEAIREAEGMDLPLGFGRD